DAGRPRSPLKSVGGALLHEDRAEIQLELERLGKIEPRDVAFRPPDHPIAARFADLGVDAAEVEANGMQAGTGSAGAGREAIQIDLLAGAKDGPLGEAWAYQLTYPRHGYEALTTILEPNLTVRPSTLIVPTHELKDLRQANMIYGPVQNAVAQAIVDKLAEGVIPEAAMDASVMFAQASVPPQAIDRRKLHHNAYTATAAAIDAAFGGSEGA
ncbi:MAG: formaldehyde-activating enzyme, partial [Anaerolineae bacterium]